MWKPSLPALVVCVGLCAAVVSAQEPGLPPGVSRNLADAACRMCHDASIIAQQRLRPAEWARVVDKMIGYGAPVWPAGRDGLVRYLAEHFGAREPAPARATLGEGAAALQVRFACLVCHDEGIILQQRLDRATWARTVDKMIGWGAFVRPEDRAALIDYLATEFPATGKTAKE